MIVELCQCYWCIIGCCFLHQTSAKLQIEESIADVTGTDLIDVVGPGSQLEATLLFVKRKVSDVDETGAAEGGWGLPLDQSTVQ